LSKGFTRVWRKSGGEQGVDKLGVGVTKIGVVEEHLDFIRPEGQKSSESKGERLDFPVVLGLAGLYAGPGPPYTLLGAADYWYGLGSFLTPEYCMKETTGVRSGFHGDK